MHSQQIEKGINKNFYRNFCKQKYAEASILISFYKKYIFKMKNE